MHSLGPRELETEMYETKVSVPPSNSSKIQERTILPVRERSPDNVESNGPGYNIPDIKCLDVSEIPTTVRNKSRTKRPTNYHGQDISVTSAAINELMARTSVNYRE